MRFAVLVVALAACKGSPSDSAPPPAAPSEPVPEVAGNGYVPFSGDDLSVVVSTTGIAVEGQPIASIANGKIDPAQLEGGALGVNLPKLGTFVRTRLGDKPDPRVALLIDPATPYRVLISTVFSIKQVKVRHFDLVARAGGKRVAAPLTLPDKRAASADNQLLVLGNGRGARLEGARGSRGDGDPRLSIKITSQSIVEPGSSLTAGVVATKIESAYGADIKRCADRKPGHYRLELVFGIQVDGRGGGAKLQGARGDVADCIGSLVGTWQFPIAKRADGAPMPVTASLVIEVDGEQPARGEPVKVTEADAAAIADKLTRSPATDPIDQRAVMPRVVEDGDQPIGLFVSILKDELIVWSVSGLEGTLRQPAARIRVDAKMPKALSDTLTAIVQRRWNHPDRPRAKDTKTIVVQAEGTMPMQVVAEVIGAVRAGPDGRELFPDVTLSSGFE